MIKTAKKTKKTCCVGCVWEHNFDKCRNDQKNEMMKYTDGTLKCIYCAWKMTKNKTIQIFTIESNKGISPEELLGCLEDTISKEEWTVGEIVDKKLYSLDEIKGILNHWRQDQGSLFDEDTDIPRLIELFKEEGDQNGTKNRGD